MNTQKFRKLTLLAAALIAVGLTGCGGGDGDTSSAVAPADTGGDVVPMSRIVDTSKKGITAAWVGTGIGKTISPSDMRAHYKMPADLDGTGQTIAIVTAPGSGDPAADLNYFSNYYKLPQCNAANPCFSRINLMSNPARKISASVDWAMEVALDVQWAHAVAPGAKIVLVTANSTGLFDMMNAVKTASKIPGVTTVSMSWGGKDQLLSTTKTLDGIFAAAPGVAFFAATGDWGNQGKNQTYPSTSPYVTAVGGTSISRAGTVEDPIDEVTWRYGGGGASQYAPMPRYQTQYLTGSNVLALSNGKRTVPDVAYNADPAWSPVGIRVNGTWRAVGGTSAGAPQWAGIAALLAQNMAKRGQPFNTYVQGAGGFNALLYQTKLYTSFTDITSGSNAQGAVRNNCALCSAGTGYDAATGLGVPNVDNLVKFF